MIDFASVTTSLGWAAILSGLAFFFAGTIGLLRFPDALSRLHALTKADNLGLGLVVLGLVLHAFEFELVAKLVLVWLLTLLSSATTGHLVAGVAAQTADEESGST